MKMGGMCFNWKVLAGLAAVGVGIWIIAPNLAAAALPLLIVLACPLSMLLMMRGMQGGQCGAQPAEPSPPISNALTREEQLAALTSQLATLQTQQAAIARDISELETAPVPVVREAETIARTAEARSGRRS